MEKATMTNEQTKLIAAAFYPHIRAYVDAHQAEYEEWLEKVWNISEGVARFDNN